MRLRAPPSAPRSTTADRGRLEFRESRLYIAALDVRPERGRRDVNGRPNRRELKFDHSLAQLLDAAGARDAAIAPESSRLTVPLRINPVERGLEHRSGAVVVFWGDEDEAVGLRDRAGSIS